ncbi:MAG TPA: nucleotidyltransferase domain-containing protein [Candidatus Brocadiales bacterium]|nr:nucleotidyltransferase domain-containing protein [Candidatus Brocadiales bacterium]
MVKDKIIRKVINDIAKKIEEDYKPSKVILFGSYAYGKPDRDSDIDLLVVKETKERPIDRRVAVRRIVSKVRSGFPFSSIVVTPEELRQRLEIGDQFFKEIISRGKVIYAR